ncbi:putative mitochondrial protein, partial [Mucuna pruriens]
MNGCRLADTPIDLNQKLCDEKEDNTVNRTQYQRMVGKLIYLSHTRLDIVLFQFMHSPSKRHLEAVYQILRYLKSTLDKEAYTDADWAGSITDRRSTSGYCTYVWGNLVTWRNKKQNVVARSSAKAEYRVMANGHDRSKHVEIDKYLIKEKIECRVICLSFVPSLQQIANIFIKGVHKPNFEMFVSKLDMLNIYAST